MSHLLLRLSTIIFFLNQSFYGAYFHTYKVVKRKAAKELVDGDEGMTHLDGEKGWATWKAGMKTMVAHDDYELASLLRA